MSGLLVIVRHGESEWNAKGVWTGTTNVHLTEKGKREAHQMGEKLQDVHIDKAYCSEQVRTEETLYGMMETMAQGNIPYEISSALNERDYGIYTGQNKWEVQKQVGENTFEKIRRGWDVPIEKGETLKMVYERSVPFYQKTILPQLLEGKNILIIAHGNSIRSLEKYIESISDEGIERTEMIFGTILIFTVDKEGREMHKEIRRIETELPPA